MATSPQSINVHDLVPLLPSRVDQKIKNNIVQVNTLIAQKKQELEGQKPSPVVLVLSILAILGSVFIILAAHQVLPNGLNAVSSLGMWSYFLGYGILGVSAIVALISVVRVLNHQKQFKQLEERKDEAIPPPPIKEETINEKEPSSVGTPPPQPETTKVKGLKEPDLVHLPPIDLKVDDTSPLLFDREFIEKESSPVVTPPPQPVTIKVEEIKEPDAIHLPSIDLKVYFQIEFTEHVPLVTPAAIEPDPLPSPAVIEAASALSKPLPLRLFVVKKDLGTREYKPSPRNPYYFDILELNESKRILSDFGFHSKTGLKREVFKKPGKDTYSLALDEFKGELDNELLDIPLLFWFNQNASGTYADHYRKILAENSRKERVEAVQKWSKDLDQVCRFSEGFREISERVCITVRHLLAWDIRSNDEALPLSAFFDVKGGTSSRATKLLPRLHINDIYKLSPFFEDVHWENIGDAHTLAFDFSEFKAESFKKFMVFITLFSTYKGSSSKAARLFPQLEIDRLFTLFPYFVCEHWKYIGDAHTLAFDFAKIPEDKRQEIFSVLFDIEGSDQSKAARLLPQLTKEQADIVRPHLNADAAKYIKKNL